MNAQEQFWAGTDGDAYTARNRVNWRARIPFWKRIMDVTGARSVYEVGCNAGWNLSAIREAADHHVGFFGCDLNMQACRLAWAADLREVHCEPIPKMKPVCELVFSAGLLIHIAPENLSDLMHSIVLASSHYVLAIEYAAEQKEMIEYRGQQNLLWKRPYGKLYEDMGLKVVLAGNAEGFDRCTYWLMEKP